MSQKKWINLHIYPAALVNASRMLRASQIVADTFPECEVHMVGYSNTLPKKIKLSDRRYIEHLRVPVLPIPKTQTFQFYFLWSMKIILSYWFKPVKVIQVHSVECLHIGAILKKLKPGLKVIYDTHELETEKNGLNPQSQKVMRRLEKRFIGSADYVIPVGEKISEWYREKYKLDNVVTILNMQENPMKEYPTNPPKGFRERFNIPADDIIFIYQGALMQHRNIDLMLKVFARLPKNRHLIFMGYGEFVDKIRVYSVKNSNIHFLDAVPTGQILEHTAQADVGMLIGENICLSYYYSLPNKFFEYILASVPVAVVDFPEFNTYINKYHCGWLVPEDYTEESCYNFLISLTREEIEKRKADTRETRQYIGWHLVEPKLQRLYLNLVNGNKEEKKTA